MQQYILITIKIKNGGGGGMHSLCEKWGTTASCPFSSLHCGDVCIPILSINFSLSKYSFVSVFASIFLQFSSPLCCLEYSCVGMPFGSFVYTHILVWTEITLNPPWYLIKTHYKGLVDK